MPRTIYYTATTLDGFLADPHDSLDWLFEVPAEPPTERFNAFFAGIGAFQRDMAGWVASGQVRYLEHRVKGLENAPAALMGLLKGENQGKVVVEVA